MTTLCVALCGCAPNGVGSDEAGTLSASGQTRDPRRCGQWLLGAISQIKVATNKPERGASLYPIRYFDSLIEPSAKGEEMADYYTVDLRSGCTSGAVKGVPITHNGHNRLLIGNFTVFHMMKHIPGCWDPIPTLGNNESATNTYDPNPDSEADVSWNSETGMPRFEYADVDWANQIEQLNDGAPDLNWVELNEENGSGTSYYNPLFTLGTILEYIGIAWQKVLNATDMQPVISPNNRRPISLPLFRANGVRMVNPDAFPDGGRFGYMVDLSEELGDAFLGYDRIGKKTNTIKLILVSKQLFNKPPTMSLLLGAFPASLP